MQYKWMVAILGLAMIAGALGVTNAEAQTEGTRQPLIQKIAERFNLKEADVQAVFDEDRSQHQEGMKQKFDDRLTAAVAVGKLTEAQKQLILAKQVALQKEREAQHETFKNLTPTERKAAMEAQRTELEVWAKENGINLEYLRPGHRGGPHRDHPGIGQPARVD